MYCMPRFNKSLSELYIQLLDLIETFPWLFSGEKG